MRLIIDGQWHQLWEVLDNLNEHENKGMELRIPSDIAPEHMIRAGLSLKGFDMEEDQSCFGYIARAKAD